MHNAGPIRRLPKEANQRCVIGGYIMGRVIAFLYGLIAYVGFLIALLYAIGFIGNLWVPKTIDSGPAGPFGQSLLINLGLLGVFAVQHSVMARPGFKEWWTKFVPESVERSTYVMISNSLVFVIFWLWQPMPAAVWDVSGTVGGTILLVLFFVGWFILVLASFMVSHWDLFGLRQVLINLRGQTYEHLPFQIVGMYKLVRHPLMVGWIVAFWATPTMSVGHLVWALTTTIYILIAIQLEERDLIGFFGDKYRQYQQAVPALIPFTKRGGRE